MATFSASLTNLTALLPQSHDCSCYVGIPILAPPPLWLQKHTDLRAHDFAHSPDLWHQSSLANVTCAWSWRLCGINCAIPCIPESFIRPFPQLYASTSLTLFGSLIGLYIKVFFRLYLGLPIPPPPFRFFAKNITLILRPSMHSTVFSMSLPLILSVLLIHAVFSTALSQLYNVEIIRTLNYPLKVKKRKTTVADFKVCSRD
jgi:hypothetical protein